MVRDPKDPNGPIMQHREPPSHEQGNAAGRMPYPGEIVGNKTPPYDVTGVDALTPLLMHVDFPATREQIVQAIGQARIALDKQRTISVAEVMEKSAPAEFRSSTEVEQAVQRVWKQIMPRPDPRGGHHRQGDDLTGRPPN